MMSSVDCHAILNASGSCFVIAFAIVITTNTADQG